MYVVLFDLALIAINGNWRKVRFPWLYQITLCRPLFGIKTSNCVKFFCPIFTPRKQGSPHQTFQASQNWHQLSVYENKVLVQKLFTKQINLSISMQYSAIHIWKLFPVLSSHRMSLGAAKKLFCPFFGMPKKASTVLWTLVAMLWLLAFSIARQIDQFAGHWLHTKVIIHKSPLAGWDISWRARNNWICFLAYLKFIQVSSRRRAS